MDAILENLNSKDYDVRFYFSHDQPIPECFNVPIEKALADGCTGILIIEEDVVVNFDTLDKMFESEYDGMDISAADYFVAPNVKSFVEYNGVLTGGLGCVLIKSSVMRTLLPFSDQTSYDRDLRPFPSLPNGYGHQDIDFYVRAHKEGFKVKVCGMVEHLRVEKMGDKETNNGVHKVVRL